VEDGQIVPQPGTYPVGEGDGKNPRAALGQLGELHYLLVTVSAEPPYEYGHTLDTLAKNMQALGCIQAYNLDGGQTATIVMNDKVVNYVYERQTSDIIYFATALPNGD
jgi:exopolysaccharide biosynthesis protein